MPKQEPAQELPTMPINVIQGASRKIARAYEKWAQQDGPYVPFNGVLTKGFSQELVETVEECINGTSDGDPEEPGVKLCEIPAEGRRLMLCLDAIGYSFIRWLQDGSRGLPHARPTGSDELDGAFKHLLDVVSQKPLPHPPAIKLLVDQGAPYSAIAIKYGFRCEDGSPDLAKVDEELAAPGTHYKKETWIHPAHRAAFVEVEKQWQARQPRHKLFNDDARTAPKPSLRPIEEMIAAHAPIEQIARLYGLEQDEVIELAKAHGVDLTQPPPTMVPATQAVAQQEAERVQAARAAGGNKPNRR